MANPLVFVKDGVAYTHRAEAICPVEVGDGYYHSVLLTWIASKGKAKDGKPKEKLTEKLTPCVVISEYPHLVGDKGNVFTIGSINFKVEIGETLLVDRNSYCYYIPNQGEVVNPLLDDLADWFIKFPVKSPWISGKKGHKLSPSRSRWAKKFPSGQAIWGIVNQDNRDFMKTPDNLQKVIAPRVKKRIGFLKSKLNKQIEPIGGKITSICPDWQKGIALVWVRFTINGVDPTHGGGCLCYLNGDFYYGPWCQRIRQKNLAGKVELLHDYPPKYTLRTWITGPLYSTALYARENPGRKLESAISDSPPKYFEPTGVVMLAKGTARTTDNDGVKAEVLSESEIKKRAKQNVDRLKKKFGDDLRREMAEKIKGLFTGQRVFQTHDPFMRVGIKWPYPLGGRYNYLKTDGKNWSVCVSFYEDDYKEFSVPVEKGLYGFSKDQFNNGSRNDWFASSHYQIVVRGCDCHQCREMRGRVQKAIGSQKTPIELLQDITKEESPF